MMTQKRQRSCRPGEGLGDNRVGAVGFVAMMVQVEMASRPWAQETYVGII